MSIRLVSTQVPAGPVLLTAVGAQIVDLSLLIPPTVVPAPFAGLFAVLLT